MELDKHKKILADILNIKDDPARISELLTEIADDYGIISAEKTKAELEAAKLKNDNESLRDVNQRLFLKVGTPLAKDEPAQETNQIPGFETLFNEKGELK
jgi:hypothetical protein